MPVASTSQARELVPTIGEGGAGYVLAAQRLVNEEASNAAEAAVGGGDGLQVLGREGSFSKSLKFFKAKAALDARIAVEAQKEKHAHDTQKAQSDIARLDGKLESNKAKLNAISASQPSNPKTKAVGEQLRDWEAKEQKLKEKMAQQAAEEEAEIAARDAAAAALQAEAPGLRHCMTMSRRALRMLLASGIFTLDELAHPPRQAALTAAIAAEEPTGATTGAALHAHSSSGSPHLPQRAVFGEAGAALHFRLYKNDALGAGEKTRMSLSSEKLDKAFTEEAEGTWGRLLTPAMSTLEKQAALSDLLEIPLDSPQELMNNHFVDEGDDEGDAAAAAVFYGSTLNGNIMSEDSDMIADGSLAGSTMSVTGCATSNATLSHKQINNTLGQTLDPSKTLGQTLGQGTLAPNGTLRPQLSGVILASPPRTASGANAEYQRLVRGQAASESYRMFMEKDGREVSAWHDVPLHNGDGSLNFICEIPKDTTAKMEVATSEERTPIKQDVKKGKLRFYPYPINWNYGLLPQTWEDPQHTNADCGGVKGDNDPVDVVEIGGRQLRSGAVYAVKPLGAYAMIDEGELDWKIICIRTNDPSAHLVDDIEDVERVFPGELERVMLWFRDYKIPDGKPANAYGYQGQPQGSEIAKRVVAETHQFYMHLRAETRPNVEGLAMA